MTHKMPLGLDDETAIWELQIKAAAGNVDAQVLLGMTYDAGYNIEYNYERAVYWLHQGAEQGDQRAQYLMGVVYQLGEVTEKNINTAIEWYTKAGRTRMPGGATAPWVTVHEQHRNRARL